MHRAGSSDDGNTLVEVMVAVAIVGIAFSAVIGGIYTAVTASDVNRKQANAATYLSSYADAVKSDAYAACATSYPGTGFALPAGFTMDPVVVSYWQAGTATFDAACGVDSGLQRVTLSIRSDDGRVAVDVQLGKRRS